LLAAYFSLKGDDASCFFFVIQPRQEVSHAIKTFLGYRQEKKSQRLEIFLNEKNADYS
jgi:hypothetical protein